MGDGGNLWETTNTTNRLVSGVHGGGTQENPPDNPHQMTTRLEIPENKTVIRGRQRERMKVEGILAQVPPTACGSWEVGWSSRRVPTADT